MDEKAPLLVYIASALQDEDLRKALENHLAVLVKQNRIRLWHRQQIPPGTDEQQIREAQLSQAAIILLLMSADFLAECYEEMERAILAPSAKVIPILLRAVDLRDTSFEHLQCLPRNGLPIEEWRNHNKAFQEIVSELREVILSQIAPLKKLNVEQERKLRAMIADDRGFMQDRLASFVGRQSELADIQQRINNMIQSGGYVTITGQAGQGKSSIIAKLVALSGQESENIVFHFIPLNPGPDHQVGLLRNLMARLILKYDLSDLYVASDNRAALRDYFPKVLHDIAAQGKQDIIYIDGLDQLEEDLSGYRDLSFLPTNPPSGIVFVLGTRPDDTLRPLNLLKPRYEYRLPNLSQQDFDLILQHRGVDLDHDMAALFYQAMQENALYLDLVAKELMERVVTSPQELIAQLTSNPDTLFSLSMARFKRYAVEWREVIKPVLGILLVAYEPLSLWHIRQILQVENDRLRDGLVRLGGLVIEDRQHRYSLFHIKLRDYLRQNKDNPHKEYIFALDEEEHWHHILATWCKNSNLSLIWENVKGDLIEQGRKEYARQHYISHLYGAREWQSLFEVLDEGTYGQAKMRHDPSMRSYTLDLDLGRQAAVQEGGTTEEKIALLPKLWQYTLLRCSLLSRADNYPLTAFQLLLLLKKEQGALSLAELLTRPTHKVNILIKIATHLAEEPDRKGEAFQILLRAEAIAHTVKESWSKEQMLQDIIIALSLVGQYKHAKMLLSKIDEREPKNQLFWGVVTELAETRQWLQAKELAYTIGDSRKKAWILSEAGMALAKSGNWEYADSLWLEAENLICTIKERMPQIRALRELVIVLALMQRWERAEAVINMIAKKSEQVRALRTLALYLARAKKREQAKAILAKAEVIAYKIKNINQRKQILSELGSLFIMLKQWNQAETIWNEVEAMWFEIEAMVRELQSFNQRDQALQQLGMAIAQAGQWGHAEVLMRMIQESQSRDLALQALSEVLIEAEQWDRAEAVIFTLQKAELQDQAIQKLGMALIEAEQWDRVEMFLRKLKRKITSILYELGLELASMKQYDLSEVAIHMIPESKARALALQELAILLTQAGRGEIADKHFKESEDIIRMINQQNEQVELLSSLGISLARAGQQEHAEALWIQIETVMHRIQERGERDQALREISSVLAQIGQWEHAEAVIYGIKDCDKQDQALRDLGLEIAQAGQWHQIGAVIYKIQQRDDQTHNLQSLSVILAQAREWEQARLVLFKIQEPDKRDQALRELCIMLVQAGQTDYAENVIYGISDKKTQGICYREIVSYMAKSGNWREIDAIIHKIQEHEEKSQAFQELATMLVQLKRWEQADVFWTEAKIAAYSIEDVNKQSRILQQLQLNLAKARHQEWAEAVKKSIHEKHYQAQVLYKRGTALSQMGHQEQAEAVWAQAEILTRMIEDIKQKVQALEMLELVLNQSGQVICLDDIFAETDMIWTKAVTLANTIEDTRLRIQILGKQGKVLAEIGKQKQSNAVWTQIEGMISTVAEGTDRALLLRELGLALAQAGMWKQAEEIVKTIEDAKSRSNTMYELEKLLIQEGKWNEAKAVVHMIDQKEDREKAWQALVIALAQVGQWEQAEAVIGMVEDVKLKFETLQQLIKSMTVSREYERMLRLVQQLWLQADTREDAISFLPLANAFIALNSQIGIAFYKSFSWADGILAL